MGLVHIDLFTTLDGVAQAPGGPEEDLDGGFAFGGWQAPLIDEAEGGQVEDHLADLDALLLGRKTYDLFAGYWPHQGTVDAPGIAARLNEVPKYVASRGRPDLTWDDTELLGDDLSGAVDDLRGRHDHVRVIGSLDLVQTLLADQLFDRLNLWVYPIVLGTGKHVFARGAVPSNLSLLEPAATSSKGAVYLRYARIDGVPATGSMASGDGDGGDGDG